MKLHVQCSKAEFDVEVALTRAILAFPPNFLVCRCCRGTAKLDLIQRRSGRNLATDVCVQSMSKCAPWMQAATEMKPWKRYCC